MTINTDRYLFVNSPVQDVKRSMEFFTRLCDSDTYVEALFAFSCKSRAEVDALVEQALGIGAKPASEPQDHGFMYVRSFCDLDGHHWEVMWMDPKAMAS